MTAVNRRGQPADRMFMHRRALGEHPDLPLSIYPFGLGLWCTRGWSPDADALYPGRVLGAEVREVAALADPPSDVASGHALLLGPPAGW